MTEAEKKTDKDYSLKDFLDSLPVCDYPDIRKKIISKCEITPQIFTHWKNGNSKIAKLAKPIINQIATDYTGTDTDIFKTENQ